MYWAFVADLISPQYTKPFTVTIDRNIFNFGSLFIYSIYERKQWQYLKIIFHTCKKVFSKVTRQI